MIEIVHDILDAEQKAEALLKNAKEEVEKIRADADSKANKIISDARNEAHRSSQERIEQFKVRSSLDTEHALEKEKNKIDEFAEAHSAEIDSLVSDITKLIIRTDRQDLQY